jgi:hypothetical protein
MDLTKKQPQLFEYLQEQLEQERGHPGLCQTAENLGGVIMPCPSYSTNRNGTVLLGERGYGAGKGNGCDQKL